MQIIPLDRDVPETWTIGPAAAALGRGQIVVVPTDTVYALACDPWDSSAVALLYASKQMDKSKRCAVMCGSLKDVGQVARAVSDDAFRFLRANLPGPYTVLLHASWDLPRQTIGKRRVIGVRMSDHQVSQALVEQLGRPILVTSLPGWKDGEVDPVEVSRRLAVRPAVVLDQGLAMPELSTVVDFTVDPPELIRAGKGDVDLLA